MPGRRRKKKSELSQWPPLTFVSSPLYQPAPVLEQDMAVTNPVTAKTVPIDDLNEAVWVSPQFSQTCRRMLRSSYSTCRRVNSACKGAGVHAAMSSDKRSKFKPLWFLHEERMSVSHSKNLEPLRLERVLAQTDVGDNSLDESTTNANGKLDLLATELRINEEDTQQHSTSATPERVEGRVLRSRRSFTTNSSFSDTKRNDPSPQSGANDAALQVKTLCHGTENMKSPALHRQSSDYVPSPPHFLATPSRIGTSATEILFVDLRRTKIASEDKLPVSPSKMNKRKCVSDIHDHDNGSAQHEHAVHSPDIDGNNRMSLHSKLSKATPPRCVIDSELVLALDTPVCDYGLSMRQRQLKYNLTREERSRFLQKPP